MLQGVDHGLPARHLGPAPAIDEAIWFRRTLIEGGLPFAGVIVNRVHHDMLGEAEPEDLVERAGR